MTVTDLRPALKAQDEREIAKYGPLVAVMKSPTEATLVRRAALALRTVEPSELVFALGAWSMLQRPASR